MQKWKCIYKTVSSYVFDIHQANLGVKPGPILKSKSMGLIFQKNNDEILEKVTMLRQGFKIFNMPTSAVSTN